MSKKIITILLFSCLLAIVASFDAVSAGETEDAEQNSINQAPSNSDPWVYTVQPGDNLWKIIKKLLIENNPSIDNNELAVNTDKIKDQVKRTRRDELKKIGFSSGNISIIRVDDKLDLSGFIDVQPVDVHLDGEEPAIAPPVEQPKKEELNEQSCIDSDGGIDYYKKGSIAVNGKPGTVESCLVLSNGVDTGRIVEYYCQDENQAIQTPVEYVCPYGCSDGACVANKSNCDIHSIVVTKVANNSGYLWVEYKGHNVRDAVEVFLVKEDGSEEKCPFSYNDTKCTNNPRMNRCSLRTKCQFPSGGSNGVKIIDNACPEVSTDSQIERNK